MSNLDTIGRPLLLGSGWHGQPKTYRATLRIALAVALEMKNKTLSCNPPLWILENTDSGCCRNLGR